MYARAVGVPSADRASDTLADPAPATCRPAAFHDSPSGLPGVLMTARARTGSQSSEPSCFSGRIRACASDDPRQSSYRVELVLSRRSDGGDLLPTGLRVESPSARRASFDDRNRQRQPSAPHGDRDAPRVAGVLQVVKFSARCAANATAWWLLGSRLVASFPYHEVDAVRTEDLRQPPRCPLASAASISDYRRASSGDAKSA